MTDDGRGAGRGDGIFGSDLWATTLERYGRATNLTVRLFDVKERAVFGPVNPTPLFASFDAVGYDPGLFTECAHRCVGQTERRPAVLVSQFHGLAVVGASLVLDGNVVGAAVGGYVLVDFSQASEIQSLARQSNVRFDQLWAIARRQQPVPRRRLQVHGELLQVLGDALIREHHRSRQYERAAAIVDSSDDAIVSVDLDGIVTSWNGGAERLYGYAPHEAIGQPDAIILPVPEVLGHEVKLDPRETVRRRKDGRLLDVLLTVSPLTDHDGCVVGASTIARDVTELRRQQRLRELLIEELNHRVKNTLAQVQSFAGHSLRYAATPAQALDSFETRLVALSKAHDVLTRERWEGSDLNEVVAAAILAYSSGRFRVSGPTVRLQPKAALALSMALHELATNAAKYGALSNETGSVAIDWRTHAGRFQLNWEESGGPSVKPPNRRGFGSRLIEQGLAHDLAGEARLRFRSGGLVCTISAPLDEIDGVVQLKKAEDET